MRKPLRVGALWPLGRRGGVPDVVKEQLMSSSYIRVRDHGPLVIEGDISILDAEGNRFQCANHKDKVALCRCGQTRQRPFCDGRHREIAFSAAERASTSK